MSPPEIGRALAQALTTVIGKKAERDGEGTVTDQVIGEHIGKSRTTVWKLRTGQEVNPKIETLEALARYFGVRVSYFLDEDGADDERLVPLTAIRRLREVAEANGVQGVDARLGSLSADSLVAVARLVERLGEAEERQPPSDSRATPLETDHSAPGG